MRKSPAISRRNFLGTTAGAGRAIAAGHSLPASKAGVVTLATVAIATLVAACSGATPAVSTPPSPEPGAANILNLLELAGRGDTPVLVGQETRRPEARGAAALLDPSVVRTSRVALEIVQQAPEDGRTQRVGSGKANVDVAFDADAQRFRSLFLGAFTAP